MARELDFFLTSEIIIVVDVDVEKVFPLKAKYEIQKKVSQWQQKGN